MRRFDYWEAREAGIQDMLRWYVYDPILRLTDPQRSKAEEFLRDLAEQYGPVIDAYPHWHPFVRHLDYPRINPFPGMDHPIPFVNAILSTPYSKEEAEETITAVSKASFSIPDAILSAELLEDVVFYSPDVFPVLITCEWENEDGRNDCCASTCERTEAQIPTHLALPAMLRWNLKDLENCNVGENWKTMVPFHLGAPASESESFFAGRETVRAMRQIWNLLNKYEVFGPMYDDLVCSNR